MFRYLIVLVTKNSPLKIKLRAIKRIPVRSARYRILSLPVAANFRNLREKMLHENHFSSGLYWKNSRGFRGLPGACNAIRYSGIECRITRNQTGDWFRDRIFFPLRKLKPATFETLRCTRYSCSPAIFLRNYGFFFLPLWTRDAFKLNYITHWCRRSSRFPIIDFRGGHTVLVYLTFCNIL